MSDIHRKIEFLIDRWCDSRKLEPLRRLLNAKASINGLTDGWEDLRQELKTIRAKHRNELKADEFDTIVDVLHMVEDILERR